MAQPTIYSPAFNFSTYQSTHPTDPLPGGSVDNELYQIAISISQICNNLKMIQRDDGALANNSVGAAQLQAALNIGLNVTAPWVTAHAYVANNFVYGPDNNVYQCLVSHTSGVFATDLANGKWTLVLSFATATTAATNASNSATAAAASATSAATSASNAQNYVANLTASSATSFTPGTGSKAFTVAAGLNFQVGEWVQVTSNANPTVNNMFGQVTSYSGTTLTINVTVANGSGAHTDWTIFLSGPQGVQGATGPSGPGSGDMLKANNLSDLVSASTARTNLGLGSAAQQSNSFFCQVANNLSDVTAATARTNLAVLAIANNLSDVNNAATALSNLFGSTPTIPSGAIATTQATNDNSTKIATTAYVKNQPAPTPGAYTVGAYILAHSSSGLSAGQTIAGSSLQPVQFFCYTGSPSSASLQNTDGLVPSGTWRAMQSISGDSSLNNYVGLFLRIA